MNNREYTLFMIWSPFCDYTWYGITKQELANRRKNLMYNFKKKRKHAPEQKCMIDKLLTQKKVILEFVKDLSEFDREQRYKELNTLVRSDKNCINYKEDELIEDDKEVEVKENDSKVKREAEQNAERARLSSKENDNDFLTEKTVKDHIKEYKNENTKNTFKPYDMASLLSSISSNIN